MSRTSDGGAGTYHEESLRARGIRYKKYTSEHSIDFIYQWEADGIRPSRFYVIR